MKKLLIVGAGGFGRELYVWASQHPDCGQAWELEGFLDDNSQALQSFGSFAHVRPLTGHVVDPDKLYLCGLGLPPVKEKLLQPLLAAGANFLTFIHPRALVGGRVKLGHGVVLCPGAIASADIVLGDFVMLNLHTTVGHDASIGAWSTLSAHCDVTGRVQVADRVFMGSRVSIIPGQSIGSGATLGAGAVVIKDVPAGVTVVGNPARVL
ncbi:MAG: acetyltransferase [Verrucomicrobia bacterium]|nr:acetyltransferase [Verrucomicrobiota bacterium]